MTTRVASTCGCQQQQDTDLVKVWIAHWACDEDAGRSKYPFRHVGGGGLVPDFTREAVHREQMRVLLYDEAPFQSEMLQSTTASDLLDARSTHENVPQTDDPPFLEPDLAEHADRMKIKQNNKMSSKILPRTQRMPQCLCQVRGRRNLLGNHGGSRNMTTRQQIRGGNHSGGPGSHWACPRKPMCHLADSPETPPPELGATALPTLRAPVLGCEHSRRSATTRTVIHKTFEINTRLTASSTRKTVWAHFMKKGR